MTLHGFQQALSELVLSSDLRSQVADRGADALGAFDLDPRETRRLLSIAEQSGLGTGILIHRSFRLSMLVRSLPRACELLGAGLSDLVHDYWDEHLPLHYNFVWESCRFAGYLRRQLEDGSLTEPLLSDLLRIDLASMALRRGLQPEQVALDPRPGAGDLLEASTPNRLVLFCGHDPRALLTGDDPGAASPSRGEYRLVISRQPGGDLEFESA